MYQAEVDKIERELEQLYGKQVELSKAWQERVKLYEGQKTLYHRIVGQPPLEKDRALLAVEREIDGLQRDKENYLKIIASLPPPVPVEAKDWSKSRFYSHTLRSWNFDYPGDQLGFYAYCLVGIGVVSRAFWRCWNIKQASEICAKGIETVEPGRFEFHMHSSGLPYGTNLVGAMGYRKYMVGMAFAKALLIVSGFAAFVRLKNRDRFTR